MSLAELLQRARRRSIFQLVLNLCMVAMAIGCAILAVILILGSALIGWQWLALAIIAALGVGGYQLRQKLPSLYQVAQWIDGRLGLADTLSTAEYFLPGGHVALKEEADTDQSICVSQRARAETIAASVDLKAAVPFRKPRALFPALTLFAVVAGLFLWRYEALGSFDPRAPLVHPSISNFFQGPQAPQDKQGQEKGDKPGEQADDKGERKDGDFAGDPSPQFDLATPEPVQDQAKQDQKGAENGKDKNNFGDDKSADSKNQDDQADGKEKGGDDQKKDGDTNGKNNEEGGSVMDKLRQAVNDLMNKMKPQDAKNEKGGQPDKQDKQQDKQSGDGEKQEGGGEQAESQQSADGELGQKSAGSKTQDPQQGVGSQDAIKQLKMQPPKKPWAKSVNFLQNAPKISKARS